jgi:LPS export ABC transporter protein LptC
MGLKIFSIILILFIAEITFLSTKKPKELKVSREDINYSTIEFRGLQGCSIDKTGISERITASRALKFKTHDELYDLNTTFTEENMTHTLTAKQAHYQNDIFRLTKEVNYENNQSMRIKSEELEYNTKTKIAQSPLPFTLTSKQGDMKGDTFVYDIHNGKIEGKQMHYNFEVNER